MCEHMTYRYYIHQLAIVLGLACLVACPDSGYAGRSRQRGVEIPDAPVMSVQGMTRVDRNENGASLSLPVDANNAWQLLNRVLADLGIKPKQQDAQKRNLLSDWVLWVWSPKLEMGSSKPRRKVLSRTYERHRFDFTVSPDATNTGAVIRISDKARQKEIDITPDSEYSWLQWQDAPAQADAAWSFARRLQGNFESALSSRMVPSSVAAPRIIEPVRQSGSTREVPPVTSVPAVQAVAPAAIIVEPASMAPAPVPVPGRPVLEQQRSVEHTQTKPPAVNRQQVVAEMPVRATQEPRPVPHPTTAPKALPEQGSNKVVQSNSRVIEPQRVVAEKPASVASKPALPVPPPVTDARAVVQAPTRSEKPQNAANPPTAAPDAQPAPTPRAVQGGLLVDAGLEATWQALLRAIDTLDIKLQSSDQAQHMLTTQWIGAMYDKKNQQFTLESKNEERWAFNLWGKGHQRHRFQLILIPLDGGARTMVYAYHTGYQVETDRTPDSSQTLLYWKDHKTEPAVAMAFLRRLQLLVRQ